MWPRLLLGETRLQTHADCCPGGSLPNQGGALRRNIPGKAAAGQLNATGLFMSAPPASACSTVSWKSMAQLPDRGNVAQDRNTVPPIKNMVRTLLYYDYN